LQGIDIFLGVLALMVLGYCGYLLYSLNALPQAEAMEAEILAAQRQVALMEARVEEQIRFVTDAETAARIAMETAQEELALVQAEMDAVTAEHADLTAQVQEMEAKLVGPEQLRQDIARIRTEYGQACRTLEDMILAGESDYRICYLTFDDGPSYLTPDFLDKLDKLDIYVTFFTIGVQMRKNTTLRDQLLRREALAGHALANHTYTHGIFTDLYHSLDNFMAAVKKQDELVYQLAGYHPDVLRFPAGSYYCPFRTAAIEELEKLGYGWIDWVGNAYDSGNNAHSSGTVASNVIWQVSQDKVTCVLMHDWRTETLGALERIVNTLKDKNYLFLPLFKESSLIGNAMPKWDD
jgi:peptidoglycan/xylan/chitin deacetylase (PgdA/CDA1 family)